MISRRHPSAQRLLLLASIAGFFGLGAMIGCFSYTTWGGRAMLAPAFFLIFIVIMDLRRPIADIREMDLVNDPELRLHDLLSQLVPPQIALYRFACAHGNLAHRAPNFQLWLDRVPADRKIVILAISPLTRFNANAVLDLEAAVKNLNDHGRKLIISGITPAQFKALDALGVARMMEIGNLCPDLEFAIARALALLPPKHADERALPASGVSPSIDPSRNVAQAGQ